MGEGSVWGDPGEVEGSFNLWFSCLLHQGSSPWWFSPFSAPWSSSFATCSATRAPTTPTKRRARSPQRAQTPPSWTTTPTSRRPSMKAKRSGSSEGWLCGYGMGGSLGARERDRRTPLHTLEHILKISAQAGGGKQQKILETDYHKKKKYFLIFLYSWVSKQSNTKMLLEFQQWLKFVGNICLILCVFRGVLKTHGNRASFLHV